MVQRSRTYLHPPLLGRAGHLERELGGGGGFRGPLLLPPRLGGRAGLFRRGGAAGEPRARKGSAGAWTLENKKEEALKKKKRRKKKHASAGLEGGLLPFEIPAQKKAQPAQIRAGFRGDSPRPQAWERAPGIRAAGSRRGRTPGDARGPPLELKGSGLPPSAGVGVTLPRIGEPHRAAAAASRAAAADDAMGARDQDACSGIVTGS